MSAAMHVEVAYATPARQLVIGVDAVEGTTIAEAIRRSGIQERFPEIDLADIRVGVFGKTATLETVLRAGDRVEIYRPLLADPKEARKRRAAEGKVMRKGGGKDSQ